MSVTSMTGQVALVHYLRDYRAVHGKRPSERQVAKWFGISKTAARKRLLRLKQQTTRAAVTTAPRGTNGDL